MLSTASKNKPVYVAASSIPQRDNNGQQYQSNQRKIVKSSSNYGLMAFNKSPTFKQDRNTAEETKIDSNLQRSDSFSSVKFLNEGEKLVSQLCDSSLEIPEEKTMNQYSTVTLLTRDKSTNKGNVSPLDMTKQDESVSSQIVQLAVEACTIAENIAIANNNRPCFKNIQTICEKTKFNVQKPDAPVANLHSQGVPWVIKNFIFSFVRILDGWKGVNELLCEKHESFKRIETQYYSPQIRECFFEWQDSTKHMLENIYKTFSALDSGFRAEQQKYKRFSGINYMALQNKDQKQRQQMKRGSPGPISSPSTSQPQFAQLYSQWPNNNAHPISQSISHGNIFSQWNTQSQNKVLPYQGSSVSSNKSGMDFSKTPSSGNIKILQNKEEVKMNSNVILQQNIGSVANQHNEDLVMKQFNTSNISTENIHKNMDSKKNNNNSETQFVSSNNWSFYNEVFNPYPNYWLNHNSSEAKLFNTVQNDANYSGALNMKCNTNTISPASNTYHNTVNMPSFVQEPYSEAPDVTTVYMNPGSYNLPINKNKVLLQPTNADFGTLESLTVHNSTITKDNSSSFSKTIMNTFPPSLNESTNFNMKNTALDISNPHALINNSSLHISTNKNVLKGTEAMFTYPDKEWENAIQLAPKFITSIHQSPEQLRTDGQRLYNAIESNKINENVQEGSEANCIESVSWNKISQQFFGGCSQNEFDLNYLANPNSNFVNSSNKHESSMQPEDQHRFTKVDLNSTHLCNDKSESVDSFEICKTENEFGSMENTKKSKKKSNQNYKYSGRKRNDYVVNGIKKMENILVIIWNMERNWPLDKEPKLAEVVKNVITFPIVSDRLKGSYYSDVHQVASDIRMIFYNAYEYLKVYPDDKLKVQVKDMQECFETMFSEEILNRDQKVKSKKRNDFSNSNN